MTPPWGFDWTAIHDGLYAGPGERFCAVAWLMSTATDLTKQWLVSIICLFPFDSMPKPAAGEPTLLTFDEVNTFFHEFGHALHGLFAHVTYPHFTGTNVYRDFVEFPSQVNEMWMLWP